MNRSSGWRARLATLVASLLFVGSSATASVIYVSEWRAETTDSGVPTSITRLQSLGVVALQTPTLAEVGRWTSLPPAMDIVASVDGRWLFLWNAAPLEGGLADDVRLHVVERRTMQVVASWMPPPSSDPRCDASRFAGGVEDAIAHPRRPRVLIFRGACWFDTESGTWTATPTSLGMPADFSPYQFYYERVSDDGRFLTFWRPQASGGVIDLVAETTQVVTATPAPGRVIAFGGDSTVQPVAPAAGGWTYRVLDRATLAQRSQFTLPAASFDPVPDRRWGVLFGMVAPNNTFSIYRLAQATGHAAPFLAQPLRPDTWLRIIPVDEGVLTGFSSNPGCGIGGCLLGAHSLDFIDASGVPQGSTRQRASFANGTAQVVSYTLNGNAVVGGQLGPVLVPSLATGWLATLLASVAVIALAVLRTRASGRRA